MVAGCFEAFNQADTAGNQALDAAGAFFGRVQQAELNGIHLQFAAYLIDQRLDRESRLRRTGGPVSGGFGLVVDHVVAVDLPVFHVVAGEGADDGLHDRGPGVGAGVHGHLGLDGGHLAVVLHADLDPHPGSRSWSRRFEDLGTGHQRLDRCARLLGQDGADGIQVGSYLAAEAAADLHGSNFDLRHRQSKDGGNGASDLEAPLGAGPEAQLAIGVPERRGVVGLDVALVDSRSGVFLLHHQVGFGKPFFKVAGRVAHMGGDVGGFVPGLAHVVGPQVFMEQRGAVLHGLTDIHNGFQYFVIDLDQRHGRLGHMGIHRGDRSDGMAFEQSFIAGHHVVGGELEGRVFAAQFFL